jgi:hypothetical protein
MILWIRGFYDIGAPSSVRALASMSIKFLTSSSIRMIFSFSAFRFNFFFCDFVNSSARKSRVSMHLNGNTFHESIHIDSTICDLL